MSAYIQFLEKISFSSFDRVHYVQCTRCSAYILKISRKTDIHPVLRAECDISSRDFSVSRLSSNLDQKNVLTSVSKILVSKKSRSWSRKIWFKKSLWNWSRKICSQDWSCNIVTWERKGFWKITRRVSSLTVGARRKKVLLFFFKVIKNEEGVNV